MYAVVRTGGKQYRVQPGQLLEIEKIPGEEGDTIHLEEVLLLDDGGEVKVGQPVVEGAKVQVEIVQQTRGKKLTVFKKQRRKGRQTTQGHRQDITRIRVADILQ